MADYCSWMYQYLCTTLHIHRNNEHFGADLHVQFHLNWIVVTNILSLKKQDQNKNTKSLLIIIIVATHQCLVKGVYLIKFEYIHRPWDNTVPNAPSNNNSEIEQIFQNETNYYV